MDETFESIEVFQGKNLSDIFHEIYDNHRGKKDQIKGLIESLIPLVQGIGDATLLVPLIKEYLEIGVKNDEQLIKLAQIVQRMDPGKKGAGDGFDFSDLQKILQEDTELSKDIQEVNEEREVTCQV